MHFWSELNASDVGVRKSNTLSLRENKHCIWCIATNCRLDVVDTAVCSVYCYLCTGV